MRAGLLRNRVTIQTRSETTDDFGEIDFAWSTLATVWATIEPLSGKELMNAEQAKSVVTHKVTMRHLATVTAKDRILYDSRTFQIESVRNFRERDISLELMCKEEV